MVAFLRVGDVFVAATVKTASTTLSEVETRVVYWKLQSLDSRPAFRSLSMADRLRPLWLPILTQRTPDPRLVRILSLDGGTHLSCPQISRELCKL